MPSPIVPLVVGLGGLAALGIHLSKKQQGAPALGPAPSAPMPVAAPTMAAPAPAPEPAPMPEPEPAPAPASDGGGGGGGGGGSSPAASAPDPGPTSGGAAATAAASAAQAPTVSSMAARFTLPRGPGAVPTVPTMSDRQALAAVAPSLSSFRAPAVVPTVRRMIPHGDISGEFGGDVQTFAKDNAPTMLLAAGSGGIIGWLFAKSIGGAVLGAALAPVAVAFAATKLIDKAVS